MTPPGLAYVMFNDKAAVIARANPVRRPIGTGRLARNLSGSTNAFAALRRRTCCMRSAKRLT